MGDVRAVKINVRIGQRRMDGQAGKIALAGLKGGEAGDFETAERGRRFHCGEGMEGFAAGRAVWGGEVGAASLRLFI
jgi:hypothetical protein